jgi:hypothetical protein
MKLLFIFKTQLNGVLNNIKKKFKKEKKENKKGYRNWKNQLLQETYLLGLLEKT